MWLMVSAIEFMNLLIDGAMPVDARKKPKSTATIAGPALMEPPRISTTRMIANRSTTDSEMATTDHTLGRSALPARKRAAEHSSVASIVPPTPLWLLPGGESNCRDRAILTPRVRGAGRPVDRPFRGPARESGRQHGAIRGR